MNESARAASDSPSQRKWRPLTRIQRRVLGVLIEKSKTTQDAYPLSVNALMAGANQKSNRSPQMQLDADEIQMTLDELKRIGAVIEVQSDGRVPRYKHLAYEWFGVERVEMAIMAELLLRGHQTLGDLRAHASRMDEIADLAALRQWVSGLVERGLMLELTSAGRGQVVSHNLYQPEELAKVQAMAGSHGGADDEPAVAGGSRAAGQAATSELEQRVAALEQLVRALTQRLDALES